MSVAKPLKLYTLEEFAQMPKEEHITYELIDGVIMMSPSPTMEHQNISGNIYHEMRTVLKTSSCKPIYEIDVNVNSNVMSPDLAVICKDELKGKSYDKAPVIVVEIVSPSSVSRDYFVKRRIYREIGVQEYWIVSPEEKCIMVICFTTGEEVHCCQGSVCSFVMPEIEIALDTIFES